MDGCLRMCVLLSCLLPVMAARSTAGEGDAVEYAADAVTTLQAEYDRMRSAVASGTVSSSAA